MYVSSMTLEKKQITADFAFTYLFNVIFFAKFILAISSNILGEKDLSYNI